jgi:hypothetical protein
MLLVGKIRVDQREKNYFTQKFADEKAQMGAEN